MTEPLRRRSSDRSGYLKLLPLVSIAAAGLVGWGTLKTQVANTAAALETKANRETVDAKFDAILREFEGVNARLDRLDTHRR